MAYSVLDRYGIKEVADVTFYSLDSNGKPQAPVLYLDTLKVSTIEQTAENTSARGGKGNPELITWDYNKEITVTLEDALFSAKSMAIMFGNGRTKTWTGNSSASDSRALIMRTETFIATATAGTAAASANGWSPMYEGPDGASYSKINPRFFDAQTGAEVTQLAKDVKYFCSYDLLTDGQAAVIEISGSSFPGTYYIVGDTYARNENSGRDEFFQFIIPRAKVTAENTITLEAEGDPSTFSMDLRVLRPADGVMMKLVKYDLTGGTEASEAANSNIIHNHELTGGSAQG